MTIDRALRILALRLRSLVQRDAVERELDEELQYHIELQTEENVRRGMAPDAARAAAVRALGNVAYRKEEVRDTRGTRWLEELLSDCRFAFRSLRHARGFTTTVVLTLALGLGANTAMFTLLRGTLLRPLPNRDGQRLVYVRQSAAGPQRQDQLFSVPEITDYRARSRTLGAIAEYSSAVPFTLTGDDGAPVRVRVGVVSGNYFNVLGLAPALGRLVGANDDGAAAAPVAVLSYDYWMSHFGGDRAVLGHTVRINDKVVTLVGVVQPAPQYPTPTDIFVNLVTSPHHLSATMVTLRTHRMSEMFARLAPDATVDDARREMARLSSDMFRAHPESYDRTAQYTLTLTPLRDAINERASLTFWLLMGAAAFVLLIAIANVANLTLMRGVGREREMLVRTALGAGSGRLRRLLLVENLTLALAGGAMGLLVAVAGTRLLVAFAAQLSPRAAEIRVDGVVLAVGLTTSLVAALALAFVPRIGGERALATSLAPAGRRTTLGRGRMRLQQLLVVGQIAVCMVLLTGAGLLVRTLGKLAAVDTGVRVDHVVTMDLPLQGDMLREIMKQPENLARYSHVRDRVAALPGVDRVALGSGSPLRPPFMDIDLQAEGEAVAPNEPTPHAGMRMVDPDYFQTIGTPLIAGRAFAATDTRGSAPVVVLSQSLARELFGDHDPIGRRVAFTGEVLKVSPFTGDWRTVVGVVGDVHDMGLDGPPTPTVFEPYAQELIIGTALIVRTSADPTTLQPTIVGAVHEVAPHQLIEHVRTLEQVRDESVAPRQLNALFIAAFGVLALAIAMVGIAGVLAFSVRSRTAEIGIRMSLGADAARVRRMVLGQGSTLLGVGLVVGVGAALLATRLLRGLLFGVSPHDSITLAAVAILLGGVGVAACWLPAARAARVDPAAALRAE